MDKVFPTILGTIMGGVISVLLALYLLRTGRKERAKLTSEAEAKALAQRQKEANISWYINVTVNPNLNAIESFFQELKTLSSSAVERLKQEKKNTVEQYNIAQAGQTKLLKNKIRDFDFEIVNLLRVNRPELSEDLTKWSTGTHDIVITYIQRVFSEECNTEELLERLSAVKGEFYRILYKPVNSFKNSEPV